MEMWARRRSAIFIASATSCFRLSLGDDLRPIRFTDHADSQFLGFLELRPGAGPGND
jgi:hypothetical protein